VVDDEYDVSLTIKAVLEESGFIVDSFTDASQALEILWIVYDDFVILDVIIPDMDGFSLYEKIAPAVVKVF
jgi:DNA-binding response OmpR family regulator